MKRVIVIMTVLLISCGTSKDKTDPLHLCKGIDLIGEWQSDCGDDGITFLPDCTGKGQQCEYRFSFTYPKEGKFYMDLNSSNKENGCLPPPVLFQCEYELGPYSRDNLAIICYYEGLEAFVQTYHRRK